MAASIRLRHYSDLFSILPRTFDISCRSFAGCVACFARNETHSHDRDKGLPIPHTAIRNDELPQITIPQKKVRSPTAVLEALASTVRNDLNQPMYTSIDDPFLSYSSDALLRSFLASYDSGKKTARLMISMNPENFTHLWNSEEMPKTIDIVPGGYIHEEPSEEALLERIHCLRVTDAIEIYKAVKSEGQVMRSSTLEKFIELLTVFNHEDPSEESDVDHFVTPSFNIDPPFPVNTWKKGSLAEEVFQSMSEKTPKAYCHMIRGMSENNDRDGAFALYNEAKDAGIYVDVFTYNKLLSVASLDMDNVAEIQHFIETILKEMAVQGVKPDVHTFDALLGNFRRVSRWRGVKQYSLSVLSEMKACGIEPSLTTWAELISIFYFHKNKAPRSPQLFEDILNEMSKQTFQCNNDTDVFFFRRAMRSIAHLFPEPRLALKVNEILMNQNNFDFIGNRQLRYGYFKDLFMIVTPIDHTDVVMKLYENTVPFLFMPPLEIYKAILDNIEMFETYHHIPRLCADLEWSNLYQAQVAVPLLQAMMKKKQEPELQQQFCDICTSIIEKWKSYRLNRGGPYLDGSVVGDMIIVFLNGGQVEKAQEALNLYRERKKLQNANPSEKSLGMLTQVLILNQDLAATKDLLTLMANLDYENISSLVNEVEASFDLSEQDRNYVRGLAQDVSSSDSSDSSDSSSSDSD